MNKTHNQLIHETSPYLLQHANNPVNWHAWNEETIEKARSEDKPLLVSVGYSTCHWCHVMERESFEDEGVAKIMNDNFICIKVDREERPDIDQLYMDAVQLLSGRGGWPLNCFALPDGRPFYGGTYFPKEQWKQLLQKITELFSNDRKELTEQASKLTEGVANSGFIKPGEDQKITNTEAERFIENLKDELDDKNGGIGSAPKFPLPVVYEALLYGYNLTADSDLINHLELTLDKMSRGGIYDQLGGGFARYSVDKIWKVPHFEKMLYDNAQLISLYSKAYKIAPKNTYRSVVYETVDFLVREFKNQDELFFSALDADSEGEEGKFYVWTKGEFTNVLGDYAPLMADYFGIEGEGYWENGKNILVRTESNERFAKRNNLSETELEKLVEKSKRMLFDRRSYRERPATDDKILTDWNAMLVSALVDAYEAFENERFLNLALRTAQALSNRVVSHDGSTLLYHAYKNGEAKIPGFLDDYAFLAKAFFRIYEVTFKEEWLLQTRKLVDYALNHFYDDESGFFFFTHDQHSRLAAKKNNFLDNVTPSGNSVIFNLMYRLFMVFEEDQYLEKSRKAMKRIIPVMDKSAIAFSNWAVLLMRMGYPSYVAAIAGEDALEKRKAFFNAFLPNVIFAGSSTSSSVPVLKGRFNKNETLIYVCRERDCLLPTGEPDKAIELLKPV